MAHFTLCADDYGLNPEINRAILDLVRSGRLNAVSCMAVGSAFDAAPLLDAISAVPFLVQVGLHLTLTEFSPLSSMPHLARDGHFPSVGALLRQSHLRQLDEREIRSELNRQLDVFKAEFGRPPDFIDGHQHIHIFPGIRDSVTDLAVQRMVKPEVKAGWIRCCDAPTRDLLAMRNARAVLLAAMSRRQRSKLQRARLTSNARFYGVNSFDRNQPYRKLMQGWMQRIIKNTSPALVMCHPGQESSDTRDVTAKRRPDELIYLSSHQFAEDLITFGLKLEK